MGCFRPVIRAPLSVHSNALQSGRSGFLTVPPEERSITKCVWNALDHMSAATAPTK